MLGECVLLLLAGWAAPALPHAAFGIHGFWLCVRVRGWQLVFLECNEDNDGVVRMPKSLMKR